MSEEKPSIPTSDQDSAIYFSFRDGKKLTSLLWNQEELLTKKKRWLAESPTISRVDGKKKRSKRPQFLTDLSLTESSLRSDEVAYENVRRNVERSFGTYSDGQRKNHIIVDHLQFFETFSLKGYYEDPSHYLDKLHPMMNVLSNSALCLVADLVTHKKIRFKRTRTNLKKVIEDYLPRFLEERHHEKCPTPMEELSEIFRDPDNFRKKQLTLLTPLSPSLLSSIHKVLEEFDTMPHQDLAAVDKTLKNISVIPQFPPPKLRNMDLLLGRVKKKCREVLSSLKEGIELPKPFAKALSIIQLSLKQRSRRLDIMASEFYPFSPETIGLQNDILGALWSLPKVRSHELKALQPLVDPEARFPRKTFRPALRKYLIDYLFYCDDVDIPDEVLSILASLNRRSRRRLQLFSVGVMNEDIEATLNISSQLKQTALNLLPEDIIDGRTEPLGSGDNAESNDFDLSEDSYCTNSAGWEQRFCFTDLVEGTGDSGVTFCPAKVTKNQGHSLHRIDSCMGGNFSMQQHELEEEDSTPVITDQSCLLHSMEADMVDDFIQKQPVLGQDDYGGISRDHVEQISKARDFVKKPTLQGADTNPFHQAGQASMTDDRIKESNLDRGDDNCPEEILGTVDVMQDICDETSLVAYRLIGHMLDRFLHLEGRHANEMTRYYLRGGSSLESPGTEDSINRSKEEDSINMSKQDTGTKILLQSVQKLLPSLPKSCIERVRDLMG